MSKEINISIIAIAGVLVLLAAILAVNFILYPVYHSYENENEEFRVKIGNAVYKQLPDSLWSIESITTDRIGNLDGLSTTVYEYEGDSAGNAVYVYNQRDDIGMALIKEDVSLGGVLAENVSRIEFDDPEANKYIKMFLNTSFMTTDESVIQYFFDSLDDRDMKFSEDEINADDLEGIFTLKCYNKTLPIAYVSFPVLIQDETFLCYDVSAEEYTIMPTEVFDEIAGEGFDAQALLDEE